MTVNCALSAYPLSRGFQTKLEGLVGEPIEFLLIRELIKKKPMALWKFLRQLRAKNFFLVVEDEGSHVLLPILQIIAKASSPKQMTVVHSDLQMQLIYASDVVRSAVKLVKACCLVNLAYWRGLRKMNTLLKQPTKDYSQQLSGAKQILYLNANLWFGVKAGGSVGHIAGVVNALVNKDIKVDYAAVDRSSSLDKMVNFLQLPQLDSFGIPTELNYYYFNDKVIEQFANTANPNWDFIYQRLSIANYAGVVLSRTYNIPLIIEYNGSEAWIAKNWGRSLLYHDAAVKAEDICLKHAHLVVTISEVLKQELIERGVNPEKIVYYPNCIDPHIFNPDLFSAQNNLALREKHHIPADALVFTFVGTFGQWHGVEILAQAIHSLIEHSEPWLQENKVYFLLVGDGLKMPEVTSILGDYINKPYVTLTGLVPQTEAPAYLAASDVLLSPHVANNDGSRFFGSPTKLFEYMAMGKPIIASALEQIGQVLQHSLRVEHLPMQEPSTQNTELALLCEPGNIQELVEGIQFITNESQWRSILGHNARQEALNKYTWEHHVDQFLNK